MTDSTNLRHQALWIKQREHLSLRFVSEKRVYFDGQNESWAQAKVILRPFGCSVEERSARHVS